MLTPATITQTLEAVTQAAVNGDRCPINGANGFNSLALGALARRGDVRIEVFTLNWRVVTLLTGPHAGKATAPCPHNRSRKPYRVIDVSAQPYRQSGAAMRAPSAPRPLTKEELA